MSAAHKYLLQILHVVSNNSKYDCAWEGVRVEEDSVEWEMEAVWDLLGQDINARSPFTRRSRALRPKPSLGSNSQDRKLGEQSCMWASAEAAAPSAD